LDILNQNEEIYEVWGKEVYNSKGDLLGVIKKTGKFNRKIGLYDIKDNEIVTLDTKNFIFFNNYVLKTGSQLLAKINTPFLNIKAKGENGKTLLKIRNIDKTGTIKDGENNPIAQMIITDTKTKRWFEMGIPIKKLHIIDKKFDRTLLLGFFVSLKQIHYDQPST